MNHEIYMKEALKESRKAISFSSPNPNVGAVIVKNGKVFARGYHQAAGGAHAEMIALDKAGRQAHTGLGANW